MKVFSLPYCREQSKPNTFKAEIKSICLTMVSAGLDTVPGNLIMAIGYLSSPHGQEIQERAYQEIAHVYPDGEAWEKCLVEEKVPYITAFVKETLRFWSVIPVCLPRTSIKDIGWEKATIPSGTTFFMVHYISLNPKTRVPPKAFPTLTFFMPRMPTLPTTTLPTSSPLTHSPRNATSPTPLPWRIVAPGTTATAPGRVCAWAPTLPTASFIRPFYD